MEKVSRKLVSMVRKYHNHTLKINPQLREEEQQNTKGHKTSMERNVDCTALPGPGNTIQKAAFWIMYMDIVEIYLLFNIPCTINGFNPRGMGGYPIYDIVRMCVPNSPLFSAPRYMINPFFLKKKKYMNTLIFGIVMAQIF